MQPSPSPAITLQIKTRWQTQSLPPLSTSLASTQLNIPTAISCRMSVNLLLKKTLFGFHIWILDLLAFLGSFLFVYWFIQANSGELSGREQWHAWNPGTWRMTDRVAVCFTYIQRWHWLVCFSAVTQELAFAFYFVLGVQAPETIISIASYGKRK